MSNLHCDNFYVYATNQHPFLTLLNFINFYLIILMNFDEFENFLLFDVCFDGFLLFLLK